MATNNAINNSLPSPFNVGGTSVTSTGTQLNYLDGLTAAPINSVNVQLLNSTGAFTYTPTTGTVCAIFELQGGGGGSGAAGGSTGQGSVSASGGGGGYCRLLVKGSANLAAITGSVGAGGTAGSTPSGSGGNGGNTTLTVNSGTAWNAEGGTGGGGQAASAGAANNGGYGGGNVSIGTNATVLATIAGGFGGYGAIGAAAATLYSVPPLGGTSILSTSNTGRTTVTQAGMQFGGGASGVVNGTAGNLAGAAGGQGVVLITEFISS